MRVDGFFRLAVQSVTAPREVARLLLSIRPGTDALATGFALVVVLNALVFGLSRLLFPDGGVTGAEVLNNPFAFMALQAATLAATIAALTWAGRGLGGTGGITDLAVVMIWLQALRVLAQAVVLVLMPISQFLGAVAVMVASALGIWIAVHFIDEAHELRSVLKAILVLIVGIFGMAIVLSIVLSAIGITPDGVTGYV
ncbi:YIP1 family protein [Citreimonas sp.]|uniref:YIP1 family protein n=1 Tax=Citreimonas sp. TaxID=3036715 RepID=UPI004059958A